MSSSNLQNEALPPASAGHRKAFHHGNLKQALLDAAQVELEQRGYEELSLRQLAKKLGVSRSAPYRHFENRDALMMALAVRWTEEMNEKYSAIQGLSISAKERLAQACMTYQNSAEKSPELYRLIFASPHFWETKTVEDVQTSSELAHFRELVVEASTDQSDDAINEAVMLIGCVLHGFAMLRISGQLDKALMKPMIERAVMRIL